MKNSLAEQIPLARAGAVVSTFIGSLGHSLKETRLTALLGYLIALCPYPFIELFGFDGKPRSVTLENRHDLDRSDILIETSGGIGVVEAKVNTVDPFKQSRKYGARWTALLTQYNPGRNKKAPRNTRYVNWQKLADLLLDLAKSQNGKIRFISKDLYQYLQENHMIKQRDSVEIYAREINEPVTLGLFLNAQMYGCHYEEGSRLPEALYFAPHFGQRIARRYPGIYEGMSYVAKIERVEMIDTWQDLIAAIRDIRGKHWLNSHQHNLKALKKAWNWKGSRRRSFIFLSKPRLAFNPPLKKKNLQKGSGWLSKRFLSFEDLFAAWGK